jgi:hypothetical protein
MEKKYLRNLLRSLVTEHHSQWDQILPQDEFAYNDSLNRSIGKTPFQIVYGMHPREISKFRYLGHNEFKSGGEEYFVVETQKLHGEIKKRLQDNNTKYKDKVDQHRRDLQFEVGDQVLSHFRKERF